MAETQLATGHDPHEVAVRQLGLSFEDVPGVAGYTARYVAYSREFGDTDPATMLARDRVEYPGGCMTGFLLWSTSQRTK